MGCNNNKLQITNPYGCALRPWCNKISDWLIIIIGVAVLAYFNYWVNPHKQCIPGQDPDCGDYTDIVDPALAYPFRDSTVPFIKINIICPVVWLFIFIINVIIISCYQSIFDKQYGGLYKIVLIKFEILLRSGLLAIVFSSVTTDIMKNAVGRPRPNYLANDDPNDALKSFPSGHTSYIFSVFFLLTIYMFHSLLNARKIIYFYKINNNQQQRIDIDTGADLSPVANTDDEDVDDVSNSMEADERNKVILVMDSHVFQELEMDKMINVFNGDSYFCLWLFLMFKDVQLLSVLIALTPTFVAIYVGCTRITDYKHHYSDVLGGALIGIGYAWLSFIYYRAEFYYGYKYDINKIFKVESNHDAHINNNNSHSTENNKDSKGLQLQ